MKMDKENYIQGVTNIVYTYANIICDIPKKRRHVTKIRALAITNESLRRGT
jgi:hypothetical protein